MTDMSWMLNPKAIRQSKECIRIVKDMTGFRLKLSDPDFIQILHGHVETSGSPRLGKAYAQLIAMAGVGNVLRNLQAREVVACEITPAQRRASGDLRSHDSTPASPDESSTIEFSGKSYPRYRAGREFKGVYRGQPRYS